MCDAGKGQSLRDRDCNKVRCVCRFNRQKNHEIRYQSSSSLGPSEQRGPPNRGRPSKLPGLTLSGLMAAVGTNQLKSFQFIAEEFNKKNPV